MSKKQAYLQLPGGIVIRSYVPEYHKDAARLSDAEGAIIYKTQIRDSLLEWIKPGTQIYTIVRNASASGMSRRISVLAVHDGVIADITYSVSVMISARLSDKAGLIVQGCGFDAGFDVVYRLGMALWPLGTPEPHGRRNGEPDSVGGYALKHSWL